MLLVLACCAKASRQFPMDLDLSKLPRQADAPLCSLIPGPSLALVAFHDPLRDLEKGLASPAGEALRKSGLLDDFVAVSWIERLQALRNRLSEDSLQPLPDLESLLEGPAALGIIGTDPGQAVGLVLVRRLTAGEERSLQFARALNAVHASGQDVEVERFLGIPLRRIRIGAAHWLSYYVLADRLVVSNDQNLLKRSARLALTREGVAASDQPLLRYAEVSGLNGDLAAALDGQAPARALGVQRRSGTLHGPPLGVRSLSLVGSNLNADLDPRVWGPQKIELTLSPDLGLMLTAPGLNLREAWQEVRPKLLPDAREAPLVEDLDRLAATLGRGFTGWLGSDRSGRPSLVVVLRMDGSQAIRGALLRVLADALSPEETFEEEVLPDASVLVCPHRGKEAAAFCLSFDDETLTFSTSRGALLAESWSAPMAALRADRATSKSRDRASPRFVAFLGPESDRFIGQWKVLP
jgi:hypothetical protein